MSGGFVAAGCHFVLGFRVEVCGIRVEGLKFTVPGSGFRFRVQGLEFRVIVQGLRFRV